MMCELRNDLNKHWEAPRIGPDPVNGSGLQTARRGDPEPAALVSRLGSCLDERLKYSTGIVPGGRGWIWCPIGVMKCFPVCDVQCWIWWQETKSGEHFTLEPARARKARALPLNPFIVDSQLATSLFN